MVLSLTNLQLLQHLFSSPATNFPSFSIFFIPNIFYYLLSLLNLYLLFLLTLFHQKILYGYFPTMSLILIVSSFKLTRQLYDLFVFEIDFRHHYIVSFPYFPLVHQYTTLLYFHHDIQLLKLSINKIYEFNFEY